MGPGALGLVFGWAFRQAGGRVTFAGRPGTEGVHRITVYTPEGKRHEARARFLVLGDAVRQPWDLAWVTVKTYHLEAVLPDLARLQCPEVVFPQNGTGFETSLRQRIPGFVRAVTTEGATRTGRFTVQHRGQGVTYLEGQDLQSTRLLQRAGLVAEEVPDLRSRVLAKLLANVAINPLTALLRVPNGTLRQNPSLWALVQQIVEEALPVLQAHGYTASPGEAQAFVEEVLRRTAANRSSMLQDLEAGRPLELDALTGWLLREARPLGRELGTVRTLHLLLLALQDITGKRHGALQE